MKNIHMISDNLFQSAKMLWDCRLMEILKFKTYQMFLKKQTNNFVERQEGKHTFPPNDGVT